MNNSEENKATSLPQPTFVGALANLSTLFHSFSQGRNVRPKGQREPSSQLDAQTQRRTQEAAEKIDTLLRSTARQYQDLEKEAQSLLGGVSLSQVFPGLRKSALSSNSLTGDPESVMAGMASLFSRASASLLPVIVPLTGRLEAEEIAIYEPYQRGLHAASERTSIGTISGDWVRKRSNGFDSRPDILLDLEYAHDDPAPEAVVEVTWVGREVVGISGGTTWTSTPLVGNGDTIGTTIRSSVLTPVDGWVKLPITFAAGAAKPARYDVWLRTADGGSLGPVDDDEDDDLRARVPPTPIPVPVPSPTPTGIPNDFFAVFDPHRWQQIEDRLGQLVRSTLTAFDGVLSDVDILRDRAVMRNVSATLRVRR